MLIFEGWGTGTMGRTADAVVVGAGLNGAATAFFLRQRGLRRIVVLESDLPGAGASGAAVGLLRAHYDNRPEMELAAKSMRFFRHWDELIGGDCGWRPTGFFRFVEPDELAKMRANVAMQRQFGERVEILGPDEVRRLAPEFRTDDIGAAIYEPDSGIASNSRATSTLLRRACADGATLEPFTKVLAVAATGSRVTGIRTRREEISSPVVVLAAGAWSRALAATCGVDMPLEARAIRIAEILPPDGLRLPGSYMDPISDSWIAPRDQGRALISVPHTEAAAAIDPDGSVPDLTRAEAAAGLPAVRRRLPGIDGATIIRWWSRPDSYAPDGKPIIGAAPDIQGLFFNTAGAGKGHKTAPAIGLALSELIVDGRASTADLTPFGLARFRGTPSHWSETSYKKRVIG